MIQHFDEKEIIATHTNQLRIGFRVRPVTANSEKHDKEK
jgi:hypothetical protein